MRCAGDGRSCCLLFAVCPAGGPQAAEPPERETVVFVGRLLSIEEVPDPCGEQSVPRDLDCVSLDRLYSATYAVVQPVLGEFRDAVVTFRVADHYGFPAFARHPHALLFLSRSPESAFLHKYQGFGMYRLRAGGWAACGGAGAPRLTFAENFWSRTDLDESPYDADLEPEDVEIRDGGLRCLRGYTLRVAYEAFREDPARGTGPRLPRWSRLPHR